MARHSENPDQVQHATDDRRDVIHEGSSLGGSTKRHNDATEKAIHPEKHQQGEVVDQDPGERQKENQNQQKDDPLAA